MLVALFREHVDKVSIRDGVEDKRCGGHCALAETCGVWTSRPLHIKEMDLFGVDYQQDGCIHQPPTPSPIIGAFIMIHLIHKSYLWIF